MKKIIRPGVYALLQFQNKLIVVQKGRGPFIGMYDMPGGGIDHGEENLESLKRELMEEVGLQEDDFRVERLLSVEEDFVTHMWKDEEQSSHLIGIIYIVSIIKDNFDLSYREGGGDTLGFILMDGDDMEIPKTNMLKKALEKFHAV